MEIFINPLVDNPLEVLRILLHELVHVWCGIECGHRGQFAIIAKAIGFLGPMTQTPLSSDLKSKLEEIAEILGDYPHASIDANLRKKQGTRLLKLSCTSCGFTARVSGKWISLITSASPCPVCESQSLVTD
jgi:predicted Zn-ribbon and HTH transcriptional regulator